jgi:hypothetical protein
LCLTSRWGGAIQNFRHEIRADMSFLHGSLFALYVLEYINGELVKRKRIAQEDATG